MTDARCYECRNVAMDDDRAVGCSACPGWAHKKCVAYIWVVYQGKTLIT